jgi:hypothetical protein
LPFRSRHRPFGPLLKSAGGQRILFLGSKQSTVNLGGNTFPGTFLLADVSFSILGVDFLRHHRPMVDVAT